MGKPTFSHEFARVSSPGAAASPWIAFGSRSGDSCRALKPSGAVGFVPWQAVQSVLRGDAETSRRGDLNDVRQALLGCEQRLRSRPRSRRSSP